MGDDNQAQKTLHQMGQAKHSQGDRPAPGTLTIKGGFQESGNLAQPVTHR